MLTVFGACAVTFMMVMYALERRGAGFVLAFAVGCALSSAYGFLAGTWPFGVVEAIWSLVAVRRYLDHRPRVGVSALSNTDNASACAPSVPIDSTRSDGS